MDAGYDYELIYKQVRESNAQSNIAYNRRREPVLEGFGGHFAPTCVQEYSYRSIALIRSGKGQQPNFMTFVCFGGEYVAFGYYVSPPFVTV